VEQVNLAVAQMDQVTQSNAANAEETAAASEELSSQAIQLNEAVGNLERIVGGSSNGKRKGVSGNGGKPALEHKTAGTGQPAERAFVPTARATERPRGGLRDKIEQENPDAVTLGKLADFEESDFRDA
jgi:hypothetical protein